MLAADALSDSEDRVLCKKRLDLVGSAVQSVSLELCSVEHIQVYTVDYNLGGILANKGVVYFPSDLRANANLMCGQQD